MQSEEEVANKNQLKATLRDYKVLLTRVKIALPFFAYLLATVQYVYMEPILAVRLSDHYGLTTYENNMAFLIEPIFYLLSSLVYLCTVSLRDVQNGFKIMVFTASLILGGFLLMCGPTTLTSNDSLEILFTGISGQGFMMAFVMVPLLPEIIKETMQAFEPEVAEKLSNSIASLFNLTSCLGNFCGAIYGQSMTNAFGFRMTADILALITFVFAMIYGIFGGLRDEIREFCSNKNET